MIIYTNTIHDYLKQCIRLRLDVSKNKTLLCVVTGGIDSILTATLALQATSTIPVYLIFMGFKTKEEDAFEKWIKDNFADDHYTIIKPKHPSFENDANLVNINTTTSMIPAYVDMYAKLYDSLTLGAITKSEYSLVKFFKTRIDDCYDCYPIIDLYKSECKQLLSEFIKDDDILKTNSITETSFGFTYDELEWLDKENDNLNIATSIEFPNMAPHWALYNDRKKMLLTKVFQLNKQNKNKTIDNTKICFVRHILPGCIQ